MFMFFFNAMATPKIYTYRHTVSLHDAFPMCAAAFIAHQHCRSVRDPVHLLLEPVSVASYHYDSREYVPRGDRHQTHDRRRRRRDRMESGHGHRPAGHDPAGCGCDLHAEMVCKRTGGFRKISASTPLAYY